jgi:hypothetical protein
LTSRKPLKDKRMKKRQGQTATQGPKASRSKKETPPSPASTNRYIETYRVGETLYGIEDYQSPGEHFMKNEPHRRFRVWRNGCGIGQCDAFKEARKILFNYLLTEWLRSFDYAFKTFTENVEALNRISDKDGEPKLERLSKFLVP